MIDISSIAIDASRKEVLLDQFQKPYFSEIKKALLQEKNDGQIVYPAGQNIFAAFNETPFDKVRVVVLGQDPYHGEGEAHGLCFSVQDGVKIPPSLKNIYKELESDLGIVPASTGNLLPWARQGVFLLNASLTVRKDTPNSHKDIGWHQFTDAVIQTLSDRKDHLVFLLWGAFAQSKLPLIDINKHCVLSSPHPSPFSVHKGFFGCKHFSRTNEYLEKHGFAPINWKI